MQIVICSFKPHAKGGVLCLPLNGGQNIWLPEGSLQEFTSAKYGEVSILIDGVDSNGYAINPRPTGAVGLNDIVDTSGIEEYFEARKAKKTKLEIPKGIWDFDEEEEPINAPSTSKRGSKK